MAGQKTTLGLGREIQKNRRRDVEDYLEKWVQENEEELKDISLAEYLNELLEQYGTKKSHIIQNANVDTTYAYQIFQGKKERPDRDILLQLAFGFGLSVQETGHLLYYGGANNLYPRVKRDAYIMFALHNKFNLHRVNELLEGQGMEVLGK